MLGDAVRAFVTAGMALRGQETSCKTMGNGSAFRPRATRRRSRPAKGGDNTGHGVQRGLVVRDWSSPVATIRLCMQLDFRVPAFERLVVMTERRSVLTVRRDKAYNEVIAASTYSGAASIPLGISPSYKHAKLNTDSMYYHAVMAMAAVTQRYEIASHGRQHIKPDTVTAGHFHLLVEAE